MNGNGALVTPKGITKTHTNPIEFEMLSSRCPTHIIEFANTLNSIRFFWAPWYHLDGTASPVVAPMDTNSEWSACSANGNQCKTQGCHISLAQIAWGRHKGIRKGGWTRPRACLEFFFVSSNSRGPSVHSSLWIGGVSSSWLILTSWPILASGTPLRSSDGKTSAEDSNTFIRGFSNISRSLTNLEKAKVEWN